MSTSATTTTAPPNYGSVITLVGPNATANIPGPSNDAADFFGIFVALIAIAVAIAITRVLFHRRSRTPPPEDGEAPRSQPPQIARASGDPPPEESGPKPME